MGSEIELVSDGEGMAVIGPPSDVERFLLDHGLDQVPSRALDLHRLWAVAGTASAASQVASGLVENSGRWIKLTAESARAVKRYGLMEGKAPGVLHAMIGKPGEVKSWLQVAQAPAGLLSLPTALPALATMMQQQAMQRQMDEIVDYLHEINEKVDDILRAQKDAVLADMIGVDLIIEDALTLREQVGRVPEITWSKVQTASMSIARTQAYAIRQLDVIAEKLERKARLGEIAKATVEAEPKVREWLVVLARSFQLQDGASVLELDRVLDTVPEELDSHRLGLATARQNRIDLISRSTARLLVQMDGTVRKANAKVLFNPFDSPAAVRSSNAIATGVLGFRDRLGIESGQELSDPRRWSQAAGDLVGTTMASGAAGAAAAKRLGAQAVDRAAEVFRQVDTDGDGVADRSRVAVAADDAGAVVKSAATGVVGAAGALFQRERSRIARSEDAGAEPEEQPD